MSGDPPPAGITSGVASRFVSSNTLEEAKKRREAEWKEAYARLGQEPPKEEADEKYDPRSLFERLQENKVRAGCHCGTAPSFYVGEGACRQRLLVLTRNSSFCRPRSRRLSRSSSSSVRPPACLTPDFEPLQIPNHDAHVIVPVSPALIPLPAAICRLCRESVPRARRRRDLLPRLDD